MLSSRSKPSLQLGSFSISPKTVLGAIVLLAFAMRLARLTFQPLWWDEGYSMYFASRDFGTMLDRTAQDIHPPLYYAMLQLWTLFVGTSDFTVRFLSVAIGVLMIPLLYIFARRISPAGSLLHQQRGGLLVVLLFAIAPLQVYYSQEVRMYGLVTLLSLASTYFFVRLLADPKRGLWLTYILSSTAALYSEYYSGFALIFHILVIAFSRPRSTKLAIRPWIFAWSITALSYLPWVIYASNNLYNYISFKVGHEAYPVEDPITFVAHHLLAFSVGHLSGTGSLNWASILFISLFVIGAWFFRGVSIGRRNHILSPAMHPSTQNQYATHQIHLPVFLLSYLFTPLALGYLVNLRFPFHPAHYERLLLLASPAFLLLVALGISTIKHRALAISALGALIAVSLISLFDFYTVPRYPNDDYRPLIQQIQTLAQPGDNFLAIYPWQIGYLQSYYKGAPLTVFETPNDAWTRDPSRMQSDVNTLLVMHPRVWLPALQTLGRIVENSLDEELRPKHYLIYDSWFGTTRLELFQRAEDPPKSSRALRFDGDALADWGMSANALVSGRDEVRVWIDWGDLAQRKLSLRLVDAKGNTWVQDDRDVVQGTLRERIGLPIPTGTPPGVYDLRLALYRTNHLAAGAQSLGRVTVAPNDSPNLRAVPVRAEFEFATGMKLIGYDSGDKLVKPGFDSGITLFWQATGRQSTDYLVRIFLQDAFGRTWIDESDFIAHGNYAPSQWGVNELVRDPRVFAVPGDMPNGTYTLGVALLEPITRAQLGNNVLLAQFEAKDRPHYFGAPSPSRRVDARLGEIAKLVGYDRVPSGNNLQVTLYWQAQERGQIAYKVFVHIVDANGNIIAQKDQVPGAGEYPTTTWVKGEYLVDMYDIALSANTGNYSIRVGMYDPGSGARLRLLDAADKLVGDYVTLP